MTLGEYVRKRRKLMGWTQQQLAEKASEISGNVYFPQHVSKVENGIALLTSAKGRVLAEALGLALDGDASKVLELAGHGVHPGAVIRSVREQERLTLSELARDTGIDKAWLSRIENQRTRPGPRSHPHLVRIAHRLGIEPGSLIKAPVDAPTDLAGVLKADPRLSPEQVEALLALYRHFTGEG